MKFYLICFLFTLFVIITEMRGNERTDEYDPCQTSEWIGSRKLRKNCEIRKGDDKRYKVTITKKTFEIDIKRAMRYKKTKIFSDAYLNYFCTAAVDGVMNELTDDFDMDQAAKFLNVCVQNGIYKTKVSNMEMKYADNVLTLEFKDFTIPEEISSDFNQCENYENKARFCCSTISSLSKPPNIFWKIFQQPIRLWQKIRNFRRQ